MKTVLITGVSSGIGQALAEEYIRRGDKVFGIGKEPCKSIMSNPKFAFMPLDLAEADLVRDDIREFIVGRHFDIAILNAAIYPEANRLTETSIAQMRKTMDINFWSVKQIIDGLLLHAKVDQIVAMGAVPALFCHSGFGAYAISKAALEPMIKIYAEEFQQTHFGILSPDLIQTPTFSTFLKEADTSRFPYIQKIKDKVILPLDQATPKLLDALVEIKRHKSGVTLEMKKLSIQHSIE